MGGRNKRVLPIVSKVVCTEEREDVRSQWHMGDSGLVVRLGTRRVCETAAPRTMDDGGSRQERGWLHCESKAFRQSMQTNLSCAVRKGVC
jgi:hypothetical protein